MQYRKQGDVAWKQALQLFYFDRTDAASYIGGKYRGSIVNLTPNTTYEISLKLTISGDSASFTAKTWSEIFPISQTIELPVTSSSTLNIATSGSSTGYILYTPKSGSTATIDVNGNSDQCVNISASYIILRGLILKNGASHGILLGGVNDVVIEKCDISGWGRTGGSYGGVEQDAAVRSTTSTIKRIIVQRTKMHHPRSDANSWQEPVVGTHPEGPQCISFLDGDGNHVFRYNEAYSDSTHCYNDIFGAGTNSSFKGFPTRDTDIYGNYLSNNWDDGLELDGGGRNIRVWGNYYENGPNFVSCAPASIGPHYIWKNVVGKTNWGQYPLGATDLVYPNGGPGTFFKGGNASIITHMGGQMYFFHNTLLQPLGQYTPSSGCGIGLSNMPIQNVYSRNNIYHVRMTSGERCGTSIQGGDATCSYNYDLFNGTIAGPARSEIYGKKGVPVYSVNTFDSLTKKGTFQLASTSLGYDQGYPVPNFSDNFIGTAPDMGAQEAGAPAMEFGVNAYLNGYPRIDENPTQKSSNTIQNINSLISDIIVESKSITFLATLKNTSNWSLDLYNITGKKIWEYKNKTAAGIYNVKYENAELPQGQYFVKLKQDNRQAFSRFVVIK